MRTWGIAITSTVLTLLATTLAVAEDKTFEAMSEGAAVLGKADVPGLVWALTATCSDGDELAQRQCKAARDARAASRRDSVPAFSDSSNALSAATSATMDSDQLLKFSMCLVTAVSLCRP